MSMLEMRAKGNMNFHRSFGPSNGRICRIVFAATVIAWVAIFGQGNPKSETLHMM